ncbi:MAG: hypothetical protein COZ80_03685 [Ignavibacteria bacterium CG_4_8_14_3_um_filter_37_9]|nr:hypothetical protein [Ignavibacteria bacterium]OIO24191.1 MAG: hypothetical protein AUJ54_00085 [Ignavibacteria bacterium CG1_02_37_35]PIP77807.1 MAG: hypothetical protein COW85_07050 [Ignavibacteria bacterium CG22_combo_CG10-13_8_21_14_all_37_15]PIS45542.1 MAG: hypothetical protein COT22_04670 [Ignavibacteria bacterium CG08_land_8_20_14_0_20_37_9]PIW99778.1 MAG: hypothetical protein COZ80_03685 [Ignavibacteria bacterium CG_4_8_14_3_um_filter_37_9]PIX94885.1 MAG: hypothetical protein COZ25_
MSLRLLKYSIVSLLVLFVSVTAQAQEEDDDWFYDDEDSYHNFNIDFHLHGNPTIETNYGFSKNSLNLLTGKFNKANLAELKLGYTNEYNVSNTESIMKYNSSYFGISNSSYKLAKKSVSSDLDGDMWRFAAGWDRGYGYKPSQKSAIIFYNGNAFTLSRLKIDNPIPDIADSLSLNMFRDAFRYGQKTEAGMKIQIIPQLVLNASYERAQVFPRWLFWKWAGGAIIEVAAQSMVDEFVDKILDSTPMAAPVINFLLKNGLSYGIYELRKDKMNWPFNTPAPFMTDSYKFGVTFIF